MKEMVKEEIIEKGYVKKFKTLFKHPTAFFNSVEKDKDYKKIMFFYVVITTLSILVGLIPAMTQIFFKSETLQATLAVTIVSTLFGALLGIILAFFTPFIAAAIIHLGVLVFRGKQGFFNTYKPITYSSSISQIYKILTSIIGIPLVFLLPVIDYNSITPEQLIQLLATSKIGLTMVMIVFLISFISFIHSITASVIGVSKFQKISKWKAFFSIMFIPILILLIALIVLTFLLMTVPIA